MPEWIDCPSCNRLLSAADELLGQPVECPACQRIIAPPHSTPAAPVPVGKAEPGANAGLADIRPDATSSSQLPSLGTDAPAEESNCPAALLDLQRYFPTGVPDSVSQLGELLRTDVADPSRRVMPRLLPAIATLLSGLLLLPAIGLFIIMGITNPSVGAFIMGIVCMLPGLLFGILAAFLFRLLGNLRPKHLLIFQAGAVVTSGGRTEVFRWEDCRAFRFQVVSTRHYYHGFEAGTETTYYYELRRKDDHRLVIDKDYAGAAAHIGPLLDRLSFPHLLRRAMAMSDKGRELDFDRFRTNGEGLMCGRRMLPWSDVADVTLANGLIQVRSKSEGPWAEARTGEVENLAVFLRIVDHLRDRGSAPSVLPS
jgi:hypothetical protein